MNQLKKIKSVSDLENLRKNILSKRDPKKKCITICSGTGCVAHGSEKVSSTFRDEIKKQNLENEVDIKSTGCHGYCEKGTIVVIHPEEICYLRVKPDDVPEIVSETIIKGNIIDRLLYTDPDTNKKIVRELDIPFYKHQKRLIFDNNLKIDPENIDDYIAVNGYSSISKALFELTPESVIGEIKKSNLRGRGGAGFPTGIKWEIAHAQKGDVKYIICNADEGDPGAYMDRSLLEGNPHLIIEGMMIGAYAIGAKEGWVYVRAEYPLAVKNVTKAIEKARELDLLGENILGSDFSFDIKIARGAGAFVCGEETSLISSIEGKRGTPNQKPPFPAQRGLFGKPTNINNVETLGKIPIIIRKGGDWFSGIGTETSKGTKIFSLVGNVQNTGLVEVPMGITLNEIIFDIGGADKDNVKAVQIGGPSGGCIPKELFHLPVDYESLSQAGAIMGSGGMIVMDKTTCMVDLAMYFMKFLKEESCGKCSVCREGTQRMYEILHNITEGNGKEEDLYLLEELGGVIKDASMCGLGQTAPNPVLSTLRYFKDEYLTHIKDNKCPAGVCKAFIQYGIDAEKCIGCGVCKKNCPQDAIAGERKEKHSITQDKCIKCGICYNMCKFDAIFKTTGGEKL